MLFCCSSNVVRNGRRGSCQMYKCKDCGVQFIGGKRRDKSQVITDYVEGKQTLQHLASKYVLCVLYSCDHCFFYYVQTCPKLCLKRMSPVRYRAHYSHNLNSIYSPIFRHYFIMLQPPAKNYNKGLY